MTIEWLAGNRIRGTNTERVGVSVAQATPTKIIDGSYTVLTYTADGKFIPKNTFNVEYLVVAGGGAGASGGGGAGGYRTATGFGVTAQSYSVTVGTGGTGTDNDATGDKGDDSVFSTIRSTGGGGGGRTTLDNSSVGAGGSGGGAGAASAGDHSGGNGNTPSTSPSQGNDGGDEVQSASPYYSAGGGGSSAVGGDSTTSSVGAGGAGTDNDIVLTSTNVTYSTGGTGSRWVGGSDGADGTANTGNGGGGTGTGTFGGNGGSGIVIIRFLTSGNTYDVEEIGLMQSLASGSVGGWHEIGRTTLGSTGDTIDVAGLADKRYLMILGHTIPDGTSKIQHNYRVGNNTIDTSSIYATRYSQDGGTDIATGINQNASLLGSGIEQGAEMFGVGYISNLASKEKLIQYHINSQSSAGVTAVPIRGEAVSKWTNTSNIMDTIQLINSEVGSYVSGSELVVLGWDTEDTHTTNFWEELASVDLTGGASATLSSGTITAKKYLWVQYYTNSIASSTRPDFIFNSDTTTSYSNRYNYNGTESVAANENSHFAGITGNTNPFFGNFFIVNNPANEKLSIGHVISRGGSGATAIAQRVVLAQKWTRTSGSGTGDASAQITKITLTNDASSNFGTSTYLRVWGHD